MRLCGCVSVVLRLAKGGVHRKTRGIVPNCRAATTSASRQEGAPGPRIGSLRRPRPFVSACYPRGMSDDGRVSRVKTRVADLERHLHELRERGPRRRAAGTRATD
jgi:hypothetical protein